MDFIQTKSDVKYFKSWIAAVKSGLGKHRVVHIGKHIIIKHNNKKENSLAR